MKKVLAIVIVIAVVALGAWRTVEVFRSRASASEETEKALTTVEIQEATRGSITQKLSFVGNIVAESEVIVMPKVSGKIVQIFVDEGSKVKKGDVIARLEDETLKLQVKQAEAAVEVAAVSVDQAKALSEIRVKSQVAQAQAGFSSAQAAFRQVQDIAQKKS